MAAKHQAIRMNRDSWTLPTPKGAICDPNDVLIRGQELLVECTEDGFDFIPCFPKPGAKSTCTRIANGTWIIYLGTVEFNGATCLEFTTKAKDCFFYLGHGVFPHLVNIPKREVKKGISPRFKKKRGSKLGGSNGKRRKPSGNKTRPGEGMTNLGIPPPQKRQKRKRKRRK